MNDAEAQLTVAEYVDGIEKFRRLKPLSRPLIGGVFGCGHYALASITGRENRLHWVSYFVMHVATGAPASRLHDTKQEAISEARALLSQNPSGVEKTMYLVEIEQQRRDAEIQKRIHEERAEPKKRSERQTKVKSISRRRKSIFDKSSGLCHYCKCELRLDGSWHVEHMMPKALGGTNAPGNLVASCATCNLKKGDKTADEFIASRQAGGKP